jgi:hypothetical protein
MSVALAGGVARNFESAFQLLRAAVSDCPDELWEADLWPDEAPTSPAPTGGLHGSAPWFLCYHALTCLDYDLGGDFEPWAPPAPFDENTYGFPNRVFTKAELLEYVESCRDRARRCCEGMTDDLARRPLPGTHRYAGAEYGEIVSGIPLHVVEHAAQIRQFLTNAGVAVQPMPGDRGFKGTTT